MERDSGLSSADVYVSAVACYGQIFAVVREAECIDRVPIDLSVS